MYALVVVGRCFLPSFLCALLVVVGRLLGRDDEQLILNAVGVVVDGGGGVDFLAGGGDYGGVECGGLDCGD